MIAQAQPHNTEPQRRTGSTKPRTKSYRILGYWRDATSPGEREFLLCLGYSLSDAIGHLRESLASYDPLTRSRIGYDAQIDHYTENGWQPIRSFPLKRIKCSIGISEGHARRREQLAAGQPIIDSGRPNFVLR